MGRQPNAERFLAQAQGTLNLQDIVLMCKTGDKGRLSAMNLRKLEKGYELQDKPFFIHEIAADLEMENAKTSLIPESISQKPQDNEGQLPFTERYTNLQDSCGQSNVSQSSTTRYSTQRGYLFTINEKSDDDNNTKAQKDYQLLSWHEQCVPEKQYRSSTRYRRLGSTTTSVGCLSRTAIQLLKFTERACSM